jgi:hypothetical protein
MTKSIPEYDDEIVCENPECKHIEAAAITGLYGIVGGGGLGVYSICEHCGAVLSKSCETHNPTEIKDVAEDTEPGTNLDK